MHKRQAPSLCCSLLYEGGIRPDLVQTRLSAQALTTHKQSFNSST